MMVIRYYTISWGFNMRNHAFTLGQEDHYLAATKMELLLYKQQTKLISTLYQLWDAQGQY